MRRTLVATVLIAAVAAIVGLVAGCGDDGTSSDTGGAGTGHGIIGVVVEIDDRVPVDGGVTIDLRLDRGKPLVAFLPSFFTGQPPPPEQHEAYEVIRTLEAGDRIVVHGDFIDSRLKIRSVAKLTR